MIRLLLGFVGATIALAYAGYLGLVAFDAAFRPTRRRFALRNLSRRRGEATLVVLGAMLGTAIITSSLVVGDSVGGSIVGQARNYLGPLDELVRVNDPGRQAELDSLLTDPPLPGTDGTLAATAVNAAVATVGPDRKAVDAATVVETDFARARQFGGIASETGMTDAGLTPTGDQAVINERLAGKLGVRPGDRVELFAYGTTLAVSVRQIVPEVGLAGFGTAGPAGPAGGVVTPVFVAPGTIARLTAEAATRPPSGANPFIAQPPAALVLVSNEGDTFAGAERTNAVEQAIKDRLGTQPGVEVNLVKQQLLDAGRRQGDNLTALFSAIGYFSVTAGLLLLVNLFVMLSEERKTELGVLRALGFKRSHILRTFSLEGAIYSLAAAVVGGIVGIGMGGGITRLASGIFNSGAGDVLEYRLHTKATTVLAGMFIGFTISMVTVFVTSVLISRFNIILAIRNLPRPVVARARRRSLVLGLVGMLVGLAVTIVAMAAHNAVGAIAGPSLLCFAAMPVLGFVTPKRVVVPVLAAAVVLWSGAAFNVIPDVMGRPAINTFVFEGLVLVLGAVVLFVSFDRLWLRAVGGLLGMGGSGGISARLGLAYPLARRFRTALLLGMFTLVIFTMTYLSVFSASFSSQIEQFTGQIDNGYDILVDANPTNPIPLDELDAHAGVAGAVPLVRTVPRFTARWQPNERTAPMAGITEAFAQHRAPALTLRREGLADDAAAFRAVVNDPSLIIVPSFFLQGGGPVATANIRPGDVVIVRNPATNDTRNLTVAGVYADDVLRNGAFVGAAFATEFMAPLAVESRYYVSVEPGVDATALTKTLQGDFVPHGAHAETFAGLVRRNISAQASFISLMQGYLGIGLIIGVAGLGVVMIRAVRERRRQIGMLRAMGFPAAVVRRAFLIEASFVALQGILLGVGLGLLTAFQLLANSDAFGEQRLPFTVPIEAIALIVIVPLATSLLATASPARQAARIKPAVALRIAD